MEFWAEICFGKPLYEENRFYVVFKSFRAQKWVKNCQKLLITVAADWQFLAIFDLFWGFKGLKNHIEPIFFMSGSTKKIFSLKFQIWEKNDVAANWQFLAIFDSFLGFKGIKNPIEPIFFTGEITKRNFSSKFQFSEKMMAMPPRAKLVQRISGCGHVQYVSKVLKIGFVFFGNNFRVMDLFLGTVCPFIFCSSKIDCSFKQFFSPKLHFFFENFILFSF